MDILGLFNYWVFAILLMIGFYAVLAKKNLIKKLIGLSIFQAAVFLLYISMDKVEGGTAPIIQPGVADQLYSNPLPQVCQEKRRLLPGSTNARDDIATARRAFEERRLQSGSRELLGQQLRGGKLVPGGVGGIDAKELLAETKRVLRKLRIEIGHQLLLFTRSSFLFAGFLCRCLLRRLELAFRCRLRLLDACLESLE